MRDWWWTFNTSSFYWNLLIFVEIYTGIHPSKKFSFEMMIGWALLQNKIYTKFCKQVQRTQGRVTPYTCTGTSGTCCTHLWKRKKQKGRRMGRRISSYQQEGVRTNLLLLGRGQGVRNLLKPSSTFLISKVQMWNV